MNYKIIYSFANNVLIDQDGELFLFDMKTGYYTLVHLSGKRDADTTTDNDIPF